MKSSRLLKYFEMYVKKFDMNNMNVKARYFHSLKSMDLARDIASSLDIFNEEDCGLRTYCPISRYWWL